MIDLGVPDMEQDLTALPETNADDRLARWRAGFEDMFALVAGRFAQADSRHRARMYLLGLLSGAERKNSWTIAEQAGDLAPDGMQRLLNFYRWDADAVRDDLRDYVLDQITDPTGVVVADETGFLKKGTKSAGVQRQYSGTAGRIENCQLGVFLTYVSARGRALIDRELYLPASWTDDRERCAEAGIDEDVEFATKPVLAQHMLARLLEAGRDIDWFTADEAYGDNPGLRTWLEDNDIDYVMAVSCDQRFTTPKGAVRADALARSAPRKGWQRLSAGEGSKGRRLYDWLLLDPGADEHLLVVRRSISKPDELAYYICHTRRPVPLAELVRVAGSRWGVEETFQFAKNETGLDHYQVRKYQAWYRHVTLSMLAAAFLAVTASAERDRDAKGASQPATSV
ncbi:SRSO17 transposase [Kutzneria kofuensis]|uniref:SRSO17 transposase n=3 Tax=Kutzneria kofuensis TaxID=103725 RepID=A0A7W9NEU2_9PSEU|nr:SRSO17 transposase [Kutzneria kofuensis]MBB5889764.1 SRSO17 transposase [Kutzneria kofuensis]MBB5893803.1 SRSO17 transposase [Kutzneria kofuensis]MBB5895417.1 SRSO17 transposase [Kutzneria kofuensis]MBB5895579.1 SRSO17 transposase [Kutzneria kofuensis]